MRLLHLYASGGILKQGESKKFARYEFFVCKTLISSQICEWSHLRQPWTELILKFLPSGENSSGMWSRNGCTFDTFSSNETHSICKCNHLTNFAVLMKVTEEEEVIKPIILKTISSGSWQNIWYSYLWTLSSWKYLRVMASFCWHLFDKNLVSSSCYRTSRDDSEWISVQNKPVKVEGEQAWCLRRPPICPNSIPVIC